MLPAPKLSKADRQRLAARAAAIEAFSRSDFSPYPINGAPNTEHNFPPAYQDLHNRAAVAQAQHRMDIAAPESFAAEAAGAESVAAEAAAAVTESVAAVIQERPKKRRCAM